MLVGIGFCVDLASFIGKSNGPEGLGARRRRNLGTGCDDVLGGDNSVWFATKDNTRNECKQVIGC